MKIMIFNVPAETVGALSILEDFLYEIELSVNKDVEWILVLSKPLVADDYNIKVLRFPWIKKSWLHRLYFDYKVAPKLIEKYKVDKVLSFQNLIIPKTKVHQILYMHNSLPFVQYKFSMKKETLLWIYQNIIGKMIVKSIKKANLVIVQTNWIKKKCVEKSGVLKEKISVVPPRINLTMYDEFLPTNESLSTFFYPASAFDYKNHKLIVEACKKLRDRKITNYKVIFTLDGNENEKITALFNEVQQFQLPFEFIGQITRDKVFDIYTKSIMVFPSYIETYGLPLLEARLHKTIIFASDTLFSHEILGDYPNTYFFDPFDSKQLAQLMETSIVDSIKYVKCNNAEVSKNVKTILDHII